MRRLWDRDWVFAHNGTLLGLNEDPDYELELCHPIGKTDPEFAFCYILEKLSSLQDGGLEI